MKEPILIGADRFLRSMRAKATISKSMEELARGFVSVANSCYLDGRNGNVYKFEPGTDLRHDFLIACGYEPTEEQEEVILSIFGFFRHAWEAGRREAQV